MSDFNLGTVTAYGYAKDKGYTGTEDEFAELMASYADVAEQAADSADAAAASATTATAKASEAAQSATAAASSKTAAETAQGGAETAAQTATTKAGEASASATTASGKATEATTAAGTATTKASEATTAATTATTKAGEASTSATNAAASATRAQEILDSIPEDYSQLSDDVSDLKDGFNDLKNDLKNINGSQVKTKQVDYSNFTISENKKITGYDSSTYVPLLANESGACVADFAISDIAKYDKIKFPRCTKSTQWIIIYGDSAAWNFQKSAHSPATNNIDLSNDGYGIINCKWLASTTYSRVIIAFDNVADITVDSQFESFFGLMDTVKKNQNAEKNVRNLEYSSTIDISTARANVTIPFRIYQGEQLRFTNNTGGSTALNAVDSSGTATIISIGVSAGSSVVFTADKDYVSLLYWSQQTGLVSVERVNSVLYEMTESNESASVASVNMFTSIGAIGDSYTAGSTRNSAGTWKDYRNLSWIATMGKRSGTDWKNYGHGGATTKSYLETTEFASALSDTACDIYFFALGQNDGNQSLTIGTVADINDSDYTQNPETFYGCYGKIIQQIKNHAPNAKLVMITNWVQGSTWTDYDVAIRAIASHYSIPVIEPFDDYFFNSALYQNYKEYGHPTALGYSSMGIAMERLFSKCVVNNPNYFKFATIG